VTAPHQRRIDQVPSSDLRVRRTSGAFWAAFGGVVVLALARSLVAPAGPLDWALLVLLVVAGAAAVGHGADIARLDARSVADTASRARILAGLSRSVSADTIVDAIVDGLREATDADHVVVIRRRPGAAVLEARLATATPGVGSSTTLLPVADLGPRVPPGLAADRIADRVRTEFGLTNTVVAPLVGAGGIRGAIVLSRRRSDPWSDRQRAVLAEAAGEASAALDQADSFRAAETSAATDALTGLPNRRYFDEYVGLLEHRRRSGDVLGILMIDIDRFKALNDRHGHPTGDEVLRSVAAAIVGAVRADDVPARFGGEEFVVLVRDPGPGTAIEIGERIRAAVHDLDLRRFGVRAVSVSVGVAVASEPDEAMGDLIALADRALYRAKRSGRDRVVAAA
jgi:diguanylate cyclase (GGDEF)-like protein